MRENLIAERREQFFIKVLNVASKLGAIGKVVISDKSKAPALKKHERDVLILIMERFDHMISKDNRGL